MLDFDTIAARLKHILAYEYKRSRIKDKELAEALGLDAAYFAVIKKRKKIPYEALVHFCTRRKISLNWVLMAQGSVYL